MSNTKPSNCCELSVWSSMIAAKRSDETESERLAKEYRQIACLLAASATQRERIDSIHPVKDTGVASLPILSQVVAQHLLRNDHPGFVPLLMLQQDGLQGNDEAHTSPDGQNEMNPAEHQDTSRHLVADRSSHLSTDVYLPCCHSCGGALQPGLLRTTVRLVTNKTLTRAQRRRLKRAQALAKQAPTRQHQYHTNTRPSVLADFIQRDSSQVPWDVRNYLSIKCGGCHSLSYAVGVPRRRKRAAPKDTPKRAFLVSANYDKKSAPKKRQETGDDFIALGSPSLTSNPIGDPRMGGNRQRLDRAGGKKKKPTRLMNFLSSLNDHGSQA
jgi:hypothetical protein